MTADHCVAVKIDLLRWQKPLWAGRSQSLADTESEVFESRIAAHLHHLLNGSHPRIAMSANNDFYLGRLDALSPSFAELAGQVRLEQSRLLDQLAVVKDFAVLDHA